MSANAAASALPRAAENAALKGSWLSVITTEGLTGSVGVQAWLHDSASDLAASAPRFAEAVGAAH